MDTLTFKALCALNAPRLGNWGFMGKQVFFFQTKSKQKNKNETQPHPARVQTDQRNVCGRERLFYLWGTQGKYPCLSLLCTRSVVDRRVLVYPGVEPGRDPPRRGDTVPGFLVPELSPETRQELKK